MGNNENGKKTIWIYAVVLFTSAFIVLLLTAISQIKFNKNINEYKDQITNEKKQNNIFHLNLSSVLAENKKINQELNKVKGQLETEKNKSKELSTKVEQTENSTKEVTNAYENLMSAERAYNNDRIIECAKILSQGLIEQQLGQQGKEKYDFLSSNTLERASILLYKEGTRLYKEKSYDNAIISLNDSLSIKKDAYYSDDCLFYMGMCYNYKGNRDLTKQTFDKLLAEYPESTYNADIQDFYKEQGY